MGFITTFGCTREWWMVRFSWQAQKPGSSEGCQVLGARRREAETSSFSLRTLLKAWPPMASTSSRSDAALGGFSGIYWSDMLFSGCLKPTYVIMQKHASVAGLLGFTYPTEPVAAAETCWAMNIPCRNRLRSRPGMHWPLVRL